MLTAWHTRVGTRMQVQVTAMSSRCSILCDSCTIFLHSHGQDAFDSRSHYPRGVFDFVHARGCTGLSWAEARHDRPDHRLEWP